MSVFLFCPTAGYSLLPSLRNTTYFLYSCSFRCCRSEPISCGPRAIRIEWHYPIHRLQLQTDFVPMLTISVADPHGFAQLYRYSVNFSGRSLYRGRPSSRLAHVRRGNICHSTGIKASLTYLALVESEECTAGMPEPLCLVLGQLSKVKHLILNDMYIRHATYFLVQLHVLETLLMVRLPSSDFRMWSFAAWLELHTSE